MEDRPAIKVVFKNSTDGWWDGGAKYGGTFDPILLHDSKGQYVKWGCYSLNFWFTCGFGRSWKHAATIARKMLERSMSVQCTVEIVKE